MYTYDVYLKNEENIYTKSTKISRFAKPKYRATKMKINLNKRDPFFKLYGLLDGPFPKQGK